jgi:hypothetical protein
MIAPGDERPDEAEMRAFAERIPGSSYLLDPGSRAYAIRSQRTSSRTVGFLPVLRMPTR